MEQRNKNQKIKNYLKFSGLGLQMGVTIFLAIKLGQYLDGYFGNEKRVLTALLALFGVIASLVNMIRQIKK